MTVIWSRRAILEYGRQLEFIARDKPSAAIRMAKFVEKSARLLTTWPELGKPGRHGRTRELVIAQTPFLIIY